MDWSKAKSIMIGVLIFTNIILGFVYFSSQRYEDETLTEEFTRDVWGKLASFGIALDMDIPTDNPSLESIYVETEIYNPMTMQMDFFDGVDVDITSTLNNYVMIKDRERLEIIDQTKLLYTNDSKEVIYDINSVEEAKNISEEFLKNKNVYSENMKLIYSREENGEYYLHYGNDIKGVLLEESHIIVVVGSSGVTRMDKTWKKATGDSGDLIHFNSAPKSILSLTGKPELKGKEIITIEMCHYLPTDEYANENEGRIYLRGKSIPGWMVFFSDGTKIILK